MVDLLGSDAGLRHVRKGDTCRILGAELHKRLEIDRFLVALCVTLSLLGRHDPALVFSAAPRDLVPGGSGYLTMQGICCGGKLAKGEICVTLLERKAQPMP